MQRAARSIPWALALALLVCNSAGAQPDPQCAPTREPGVERCVLGLPAPLLARMNEPQQHSNWCWAAVIHMVLSRYGVDIPQERIVEAHFGRSVNDGVAPQVLADLLNRTWRDEAGRALRVNARVVPSWWRSFGVTAPDVLEDLAAERPVVLAMPTHAVVLVQLVYERSRAGSDPAQAIRLVRGVVLDPASAHGLRSLRPDELRPELLARVSAEPMADAAPGPQAPVALEQAQPGRTGHAHSVQ